MHLLGIGVWDASRLIDPRNHPRHQGVGGQGDRAQGRPATSKETGRKNARGRAKRLGTRTPGDEQGDRTQGRPATSKETGLKNARRRARSPDARTPDEGRPATTSTRGFVFSPTPKRGLFFPQTRTGGLVFRTYTTRGLFFPLTRRGGYFSPKQIDEGFLGFKLQSPKSKLQSLWW